MNLVRTQGWCTRSRLVMPRSGLLFSTRWTLSYGHVKGVSFISVNNSALPVCRRGRQTFGRASWINLPWMSLNVPKCVEPSFLSLHVRSPTAVTMLLLTRPIFRRLRFGAQIYTCFPFARCARRRCRSGIKWTQCILIYRSPYPVADLLAKTRLWPFLLLLLQLTQFNGDRRFALFLSWQAGSAFKFTLDIYPLLSFFYR